MNAKTIVTSVCLAAAMSGMTVWAKEQSLVEQIESAPVFSVPFEWLGTQEPPDQESQALLKAVQTFESGGASAGIPALEDFLLVQPHSVWAPSMHVSLAEYYRLHGSYSLALAHWEEAWNATKDGQDAVTKKLAVRTLAGWTRLLASLGEKEKLSALFKEADILQLPLGIYATTINGTKEGLAMMQAKPEASYRCGSFALGHVAMALGLDTAMSLKLFKAESPDGGFNVSELLALAQTNGMTVEAVKRPAGADLIVPSVVHWKLNHYAAITAKKGDLYLVEDPTFEGHGWLDAETIEAESSGDFIVPKGRAPASWSRLSETECAHVYGKGYPNVINDSSDDGSSPSSGCGGGGGGGGDGSGDDGQGEPPQNMPTPLAANQSGSSQSDGNGPSSNVARQPGMPQWSVSEPYITLWLKDSPLLYHRSDGEWVALNMSYKSRGDAQNANGSGFGDKWSCNWFGMLQFQSATPDVVVDYRAGGGQETFKTDGTLSYKTARAFKLISGKPALADPYGAENIYGLSIANLTGTTNCYLTERRDRYGRVVEQFKYEVVGSVVRMTNMIDLDGQTNTLAYGNGTYPHLVTAVTNCYGQATHFTYNGSGLLTNILDAQGMATSFKYDSDENITNMVTPYGTNVFKYFSGTDTNDLSYTNALARSLLITEPDGSHQLYVYRDNAPGCVGCSYVLSPEFRNSFHWNRLQFSLLSAGGQTNLFALSSDDYGKAWIKHWLHGDPTATLSVSDTLEAMADPVDPTFYGNRPNCINYRYQGDDPPHIDNGTDPALKRITTISQNSYYVVDMERNNLGLATNIIYYNEDGSTAASYTNNYDASGTILKTILGPRHELVEGCGYDPVISQLLTSITNAVGDVTRYTYDSTALKPTSIIFSGGLLRTNFYYASGSSKGFLQQQIDTGFRTNSFAYTSGNLTAKTNELGLVTTYLYDNLNRLVSTAFPDGTTVSNVYDKLDIVATKDRLNQWAYYVYNPVRQLIAVTNVNGQVTTYDYCGCGAPSEIVRWNGATPLVTEYEHNLAGLTTNVTYPDGYRLGYAYDFNDRLQTVTDGSGNHFDLTYFRVGFQDIVNYTYVNWKQLLYQQPDEYGRVTNSVDRNGVTLARSFDFLNRLTTRQSLGGYGTTSGVETFAYNALGLTNYTDQLSHLTTYVRDAAGRVLYETNANLEVLQYAYNPADELLTLTDGKNQTTRWNYDAYGRATNKVDATTTEIFRYQYDPLDRLTNRWSAAKTNTVYKYDPIGNLTNVLYPVSSPIVLRYDPLNRLTNMVDAVGSTAFRWTDGDQLASETGPWAADAVGYTYNASRQRQSLNLAQPNASPWTQSYAYDIAMRLSDVVSPVGDFNYQYNGGGGNLVTYFQLYGDYSLGTSSRTYDDLSQLVDTITYTYASSPSSREFQYSYDAASQRTQQVFTAGNYINYTYDNIGQLKTAKGYDPQYYDYNLGDYVTPVRLHEQYGYAYDKAWNLAQRTNNALVQSFGVNNLNELTNAARTGTLTVAGNASEPKGGSWDGYEWSWYPTPYGVTNVTVSGTGLGSGLAEIYVDGSWARTNATPANGANTYTAVGQDNYGRAATTSVGVNLPTPATCRYDLNGNLLGDGTRNFAYDDENQLISMWQTNVWREDFVYDGMLRRRITRQFSWNGSSWVQTNEIRFIYDGNLVIQERDGNNLPKVTYTRGNDLSGSLQGAGGIGGVLARTDNSQLIINSPWASACYFYDGNGNVMGLEYTNGAVAADYRYDPFGNLQSLSGPLAQANTLRFSSKEWDDLSGLSYYLYRFYDPNLQRWLNRDPLGEYGGYNIYQFNYNSTLYYIDPDGLSPASVGATIGFGLGATIGGLIGAAGGTFVAPGVGTVAGAGEVGAAGAAWGTALGATAGNAIATLCHMNKGNGERGIQGNDPNPWKGWRPNPDRPGWGWKKDPQTGKDVPKPRPPGPPPKNHPTW